MRPTILTVLFFLAAPVAAAPRWLQEAQARVKALAQAQGFPYPLQAPEIRVYKEEHQLELFSAGKLVKRYGVGLGDKGLADKRRQGDHLTPEGNFYVCSQNERSQFHLFLGLSYPHEAAAARGLKEGRISRPQHDSILRALRNQSCPPWNTRLGGAVGIHGGGSSADWTWGCVALSDSEIEELWVACPPGTPVVIQQRRPLAERAEERHGLMAFDATAEVRRDGGSASDSPEWEAGSRRSRSRTLGG